MEAILIPAYQPDSTLLSLVKELLDYTTGREAQIVVVDDGSSNQESLDVFETLEKDNKTIVLRHDKNQGKGGALKTGLRWAVDNNCQHLITADADGQHLPKDIIRVMEETVKHDELVLGVRTFDEDTPLRSRLGNNVTSAIFSLAFGKGLQDTQTGLRGIPKKLFESFLSIKENGYDYEFKCLVNTIRTEKLIQLPIETIYEPGNPTSHFRPIADSTSIYFVLLRHLSTVSIFALVDYSLFVALTLSGVETFEAICISRSISFIVYFMMAKNFVFKSKNKWPKELIKYTLLVGFNIVALSWFIDSVHAFTGIPKPVIHPVGSILFFILNFIVQKTFIFGERNESRAN